MNLRMVAGVFGVTLFSLLTSSALCSDVPYVTETGPEDLVCVSGRVYDSSTQEAIAGASICIFVEGIPPDSSLSTGTIYEGDSEYPLPPMPRHRWFCFSDKQGRFSVCGIPEWLSDKLFTIITYRPGYVPLFEEHAMADPESEPSYDLSLGLVDSQTGE